MHCLLPLITSLFSFYFLLLPSPLFSLLPHHSFLTFVSLCLSSSLVYFNHLVSHLLPSPTALHPPERSPLLLSTSSITPSVLSFTSSYPSPPTIFLSLFWQSKQVSSICCVAFYGPAPSQPQQPRDNGHHTQPNSGLKEIYRAIMRRLPHWRFTTAKSTGLNTPSKSTTWLPSL